MLKFISKFVLNIFPSVAASVIGAYIVHNYITAKPVEAPSATTASTVTPNASSAGVDNGPSVIPIPVNAKVADVEAPAVTHERADRSSAVSTSDSTATGRDRHSAVHVRSAHALSRSARERLGVADRASRSAETSPSQRERVQVSNAATPAARSGPIVMPAVDFVPDQQAGQAMDQLRIGMTSGSTRADPMSILPSAEMPLMKRLAGLSNDVEAKLVSQTLSTADDIVTVAKSAFHAVVPR
jgi:hypothetical protein